MFTSEINVGDVVRTYNKTRNGVEIEDIRITDCGHRVDEKTGKMFCYAGFVPPYSKKFEHRAQCGFGYTRLYNPGDEHEFGCQKWEVIGHEEPRPMSTHSYPSLKGNRGYDLMM